MLKYDENSSESECLTEEFLHKCRKIANDIIKTNFYREHDYYVKTNRKIYR